MAHEIFISYSSKNRELTRKLENEIEAQYGTGSVWWDDRLVSSGEYEVQIRNALSKARAVVVIWTKAAVQSSWVRAEADEAYRTGKLVHVKTPELTWREMPPEYSRHHVKELVDIDGILRSVAAVWQGAPIRTEIPLHEIFYRLHGVHLIDPKRRPLPSDLSTLSPTELLQPKFAVAPFVDVNDNKAAFIEWCTNSSRPTAGRLVHGSGGLGKTRLMIEIAEELRSRGWMAGFLERPLERAGAALELRHQALDQLIAHGEDEGIFIVLDYAEGRQNEIKTIAQLVNAPEPTTRPIRLVLLTRGAGDWWTALHDETPDVEKLFRNGRDADIIALPAIVTGEQRLALFANSVEKLSPFLRALGFAPPSAEPDPVRLRRIETGEGYSRPLAIQMEALLYLASASPDAEGLDGLLRKVIGIERDHWRKLIGPMDEDRIRDMNRAVAQVTAVQGTSSTVSTERLLMADEFYKGQRTARVQVDPVLRGVSRVYGRDGGGVAHLEPDLIGEHQVASIADRELVEGCLRWIMDGPESEQTKRRRDLITVLQRATQPEHGARAVGQAKALLGHLARVHIDTLVTDIVAVIAETPGALAHVLKSQIDHYGKTTLVAIDLAIGDVLQTQKLAHELLMLGLEDPSNRMDDSQWEIQLGKSLALRYLSMFLSSRRRELLHAEHRNLEDAVRDNWIASHGNPSRGRPLTEFEGGAALYEDVDFYRRLAQQRPYTFKYDFLSVLDTLEENLRLLGHRDEAMTATEEAISFSRQLAVAHPDFLFLLEHTLQMSRRRLDPARAAEAAHEALVQCTPLLERAPHLQPSVGKIFECYRELCAAAQLVPDPVLLESIDRAATEGIRSLTKAIQQNPARTTPYLQLLEVYEKKGDIGVAIPFLTQVIQDNPAEPMPYVYLLEVYEKKGDIRAAVPFLTQVIQSNPAVELPYGGLLKVCEKKGDISAVIPFLTKVIEDNPDEVVPYGQLLIAYEKQGDISAAIPFLTKMTRDHPRAELPYVLMHAVYEKKGDIDAAIAFLTKAIRDNPANGAPYWLMQQIYEKKGDVSAAIPFFTKVIQDNPAERTPYVRMLMVYEQAGNVGAAIPFLIKMIQDHPGEQAPFDALVGVYEEKGDINAAVSFLTGAIHDDPAGKAAYGSLLGLYERQGDIGAAIPFLTKLIEDNPTEMTPYVQLVVAHEQNGDIGAAIPFLTKMIQNNLGKDAPLAALVHVYEIKGDVGAAIPFLTDLIRDNLEEPTPYWYMLQAYEKQGNIGGAIPFLTKLIEDDPAAEMPFEALLQVYEKKGDIGAAIPQLTKVIKDNPGGRTPYCKMLEVYEKKGDVGAAIPFLTKLIQDNPTELMPYFWMATAHEKKGDIGAAIPFLTKVIEDNPGEEAPYEALAYVCEKKGNTDAAIPFLTTLIEDNPAQGIPYLCLLQFYEKKGDLDAAIPFLTKVIQNNPTVEMPRMQLSKVLEKKGDSQARKLGWRSWFRRQ